MKVTKDILVDQMRARFGYTKKSAIELIDDFTTIILENLRKGNAVHLSGFGSFEIVERAARSCPHPITGEPIQIPPHYVPRFYPFTQMKREVKMFEGDLNKYDAEVAGIIDDEEDAVI